MVAYVATAKRKAISSQIGEFIDLLLFVMPDWNWKALHHLLSYFRLDTEVFVIIDMDIIWPD